IIYCLTNKSYINILKEVFIKNKQRLFIINICILILFFITFVTGYGWYEVWGGRQFRGVISFPHDACYFFAGLQVNFIIFYNVFEKKIIKKISFIAVLIYLIFSLFTNARAAFIIPLFSTMYFLYKIFYKNYIAVYFLISIPLIIILIMILFGQINIDFLSEIPILNKFISLSKEGDTLSSRDVIWNNITYSYRHFTLSNKIIGKGTEFTQNLNLMEMGRKLWAHNDLLECLVAIGYYGLGVYLVSLIVLLKRSRNLLFLVVILFVAFFNGLFVYPQIIIAIPNFILMFNLYRKD
uniref:hypothetical protein n=1 Tax=Paraclostridium bifermentans TaxID=1490 RepID=UPI00374EC8A0